MAEPLSSPPKASEEEGEPTGVTVIDDVRIGKTFGAWRILRTIATGTVGVVYEAEDAGGRRAAVKFLPELIRRAPDPDEGLYADARAASALGHDGIVPVLDSGRGGGACWLAMELQQPRSAAAFLRAKGRLPWAEATSVAVECCAALEAAHAAGILHRDIKPADVLVSAAGKARLVDFGVAREFHRRAAPVSPYASPEQSRGEALDALSDIYSLGATYHALLTGEPPPSGDAPPDPRKAAADVPEAAAKAIARAMAKEPAERYRSVKELRADLEAALQKAPEAERQLLVAADPEEQIKSMESRSSSLAPPSRGEPKAAPKSDAPAAKPAEPKAEARTSTRPAADPPAIKKSNPPPPDRLATTAAEPASNPWKLVSVVLALALIGVLLATFLGKAP
jgi:urea transport system substrate-binding protein